MNAILILYILLLHLIAAVMPHKEVMALVCPKGLQAKGISWYYVQKSTNFSICVNCKPENESSYEWIEICYANNENPLGGHFLWNTHLCENYNNFDGSNQLLLKICQAKICGLKFSTGIPQILAFALGSVQSIPCANGVPESIPCTNSLPEPTVITEIKPNIVGYDIDLVCPEKSTLLGFERFNLQYLSSLIPVLSAVCHLNDTKKDNYILIYAKGKWNDPVMMKLFAKNPGCPSELVTAGGTRCNFKKKNSNYCGLRWNSTTSEQPNFDFLTCPKINNNTKSVAQECAQINIQNIYIIIGVFLGF